MSTISTRELTLTPYEVLCSTTGYKLVPTKRYNFSGVIPGKEIYIKKVIYSDPATIVFWSDDTKTVCKCKYPDTYSKEIGFSLCILKKIYGATAFKKLLKDWVPAQDSFVTQQVTLKDVMKSNK